MAQKVPFSYLQTQTFLVSLPYARPVPSLSWQIVSISIRVSEFGKSKKKGDHISLT